MKLLGEATLVTDPCYKGARFMSMGSACNHFSGPGPHVCSAGNARLCSTEHVSLQLPPIPVSFPAIPINKGPRTVAIFADYDGCFDLISPSNPSGGKTDDKFDQAEKLGKKFHSRRHAERLLTDYLEKITHGADNVILFSGSNRQSRERDEFNATRNGNGLARIGLKQLAERYNWQYNPSSLEDAGNLPIDIMGTHGGSEKIKQMLVENNFSCLTGPTEVYFFDDVEKYLDYVRENAKTPSNIELKTVLFDWFGICIDGTQQGPLLAKSSTATCTVSRTPVPNAESRAMTLLGEATPVADPMMLAQLRQMTLGGVKKIAKQKGVDKDAVEDCDDCDDPKEAVIQHILAKTESVALMKEKMEQRQQSRNGRKLNLSRNRIPSASVPSLCLRRHDASSESHQEDYGEKRQTHPKFEAEAEVGKSSELARKPCALERDISEAKMCDEEHPCTAPSTKEPSARSAAATVRFGRRSSCGGA